MKKISLLFIAFLATALFADITTVTVPPEMLHAPGGGQGFMGKVSYTLNISRDSLNLLAYDSILVSLEIVPAAGGTPLQLEKVEGAVGVLHILPKQPTRDIFFTCKETPSGKYIARVKVTAIETDVMKKTKAMVNEATKAQMVGMFTGIPNSTDPDNPNEGAFFHQPGMTTASGKFNDIWTADGPHGLNGVRCDGHQATAFLTCGGMACTWDVDAAFEQGAAMGEEFRKDGRNVCLGPAMNVVLNPQGGRAFEYYSEDSYLAGKMAASTVRGLATRGVIAAIKHFAVNNKETDREKLSALIDERSLHELYLPQYKECVIKGGALATMTAYNKVNGQYCTDSKYLVEDVLRNTWGFLGYTMSDWDAKINDETRATCVKYGADQLLPSPLFKESDFSNIIDAKNKAKHIVYANGKVGLLDAGYSRYAYTNTFMSTDKRDMIRKLGAKALILAKNDGNILPIPKTGKKIFITGAAYDVAGTTRKSQYSGLKESEVARLGGGDSYIWESSLVAPPANRRISPKQGITEYLAALTTSGKTTIVDNMYSADYIIVATGVHGEGEGMDRPDMKVFEDKLVQDALKVTTAKTIVLYTGGSAALPGNWSTAPAILICFGPGQEQGKSIADVLFGDVCPGGKLNVTFPNTEAQTANFEFKSGTYELQYGKANEAHGYFKVDNLAQEPLFAFGHGLSYTTFSYENLQVYPATIKKGDRVYVSVDVSNTGKVKGDEVVQLYLSLPSGTIAVRKQDLRGFDRVTLEPGASQKVSFALDPEDMSYFKVGSTEFDGNGTWDILTGSYKVRVGTSSKITPAPEEPSVAGSFTVN